MTVSLRRQYRLYRFYDEHDTLLYIGMTGRAPSRRLLEHVCEKPWAHEMARWEVDPRAFDTEAEVLAAERAAIRAEHPRHNVVHNGRGRTWRGAPPPGRSGWGAGRRGGRGRRGNQSRRAWRRLRRIRPRSTAGKRIAGWATLSLFVAGLSLYFTDFGLAPSGLVGAAFGCVVLVPGRRRRRR